VITTSSAARGGGSRRGQLRREPAAQFRQSGQGSAVDGSSGAGRADQRRAHQPGGQEVLGRITGVQGDDARPRTGHGGADGVGVGAGRSERGGLPAEVGAVYAVRPGHETTGARPRLHEPREHQTLQGALHGERAGGVLEHQGAGGGQSVTGGEPVDQAAQPTFDGEVGGIIARRACLGAILLHETTE
jgi:hypothetical protein